MATKNNITAFCVLDSVGLVKLKSEKQRHQAVELRWGLYSPPSKKRSWEALSSLFWTTRTWASGLSMICFAVSYSCGHRAMLDTAVLGACTSSANFLTFL